MTEYLIANVETKEVVIIFLSPDWVEALEKFREINYNSEDYLRLYTAGNLNGDKR